MKKICLIASSGGHLQEIYGLRGLARKYDVFLITEQSEFQKQYMLEKTYFVNKIDRKEKGFLSHFIQLIKFSAKIMKKEKPDIIISTGALISVPMIYLGWLQRKKIIFMETIARVEALSLTGKLVYPVTDLFIVQWQQLADKYKKAVFVSRIS